MLKKNELLKTEKGIFRVLEVRQNEVLVIDCIKQTMPLWIDVKAWEDAETATEKELLDARGMSQLEAEYNQALAHQRFTMIAAIIAVVGDKSERNYQIRMAAERNQCSKQTIREYLCLYLSFQDLRVLAPIRRKAVSELTPDQKNMRWAINKFYYNRYKNPLTTAYIKMLQEKYTDGDGKLLPDHPSIRQFRFFFKKYDRERKQTAYISRGGIKDYQRNHRPLLGDGVQEFAPAAGTAMNDGTICDIYLVDDAGKVVGRPLLVVSVDAYSGMILGYFLGWEGGVYSLRGLITNILEDKVEHCRRHGIEIEPSQWPVSGELPGVMVSDRGSEYMSETFSQLAERGVKLINVESFRPELKGSVESLFEAIQSMYRQYLHGCGTLEADYAERGAKDYRKEAKLTLRDFEQIVIRCIVYYNSQRLVENFPYTEEMLDLGVRPCPSALFEYGKSLPGAHMIPCSVEDAMLTLMPRTNAQFTRNGLRVNGLRYNADGFTEAYLRGGTAAAAYNPEDVSCVWLVRNGEYIPFRLIERRFMGRSLGQVRQMQVRQRELVSAEREANLQAKIDLANHIEAVAGRKPDSDIIDLKGIQETRQRERERIHIDFCERRKGV